MAQQDEAPTVYRISTVNRGGEVFKRTTTKQREAEFVWRDVDGASHVLFAAFFVDGRLERQFARPFTR